jgi:hypothetical protein
MTAIITDALKKQLTQTIFDENEGVNLGDSNNYYYIGVGRSQVWGPDTVNPTDNTPTLQADDNTLRQQRLFRYSMQSVKRVEAFSFAVPLRDWSSGAVYRQFSDNIAGQPSQSFYVRTDDNNVYLCVRQGKTAEGASRVSTAKPDHTDTSLPIETDGYVWKFLYTISTADANRFLTDLFMPVKFVDSASPTSPDAPQKAVQDAAVPGQIIGYRVTNANKVFTTAPKLTVVGNGSGARAKAILSATKTLAAVEVDDSNGTASVNDRMGSGYDYANVLIQGVAADSAEVVPVFGPKGGLGADPRNDLRSTHIMFNIKPEGKEENNTWLVENSYRQIGLLKNITAYNSATKFTGTSGLALKTMKASTDLGAGLVFTGSKLLTQSSTGAKGWLDYFDDSSTFWYHQDEYTGFTPFSDNVQVNVEDYGDISVDSANVPGDIDIFSGDLLFIDNRANPVPRAEIGAEDIKVVVRL